MKFVCDKCKTKYSIADEKVRRKVLKIRCKNCSSIIIVREPAPSSELTPEERGGPPAGRALERAFDGVFKPRPNLGSSQSPALRVQPLPIPDLATAEEEIQAEATRLSSIPAFTEEAGLVEDEWYLAVDGNQFGPMGFSELCSRIKRGETGVEAFVWRDGFDEWTEIGEVPELRSFLPRHPPPPPRARSGLFPAASLAPMPARPQVPQLPQFPPMTTPAAPPPPSYVAGLSAPGPPYQPPQPPQQLSPAARSAPSTFPPTPAFSPAGSDHDLASLFPPAALAPPAGTVDSGLRPLPPIADSQIAAPPRRPTAKTPLVMKITAAAGIVAALCGVALMVYFFVFDRGKDQRPVAHNVAPPTEPTTAVQPALQPDGGSRVSIDFPPLEIERSAKAERPVHTGRTPHAAKTKPVAPAAAKGLTEEQKRLMALYNKGGGPSSQVPASAAPERRSSVPVRQLSSNEILGMQRRHSAELKACYERALKHDESLSELKVDVSLTVADNGMIKSVRLQGTNDPDLVKCIQRTVRHWAFDPIGSEQDYKFPIVFRGS